MRIGLIADIHGNPLALDAVLGELERAGVDEIVCLGDVAPGPQPVPTIRRLRELGSPVVLGNWDAWLVDRIPPLPPPAGDKLREQGEWWSAQLGDDERAYLRDLPPSVEVEAGGGTILCVHGSPRAFTDDIHATTPDEALGEMLDGRDPLVLATGHTHVELVRVHASTLIVNPGSVGLPFHSWPPPNGEIRMSPWAECAILNVSGGLVSTELRRVPYDVRPLLESAVASGMPHARWWASCWLTLTANVP
ncbi:MAG TPA: metallophosphoesterase family protein [Gaiellaceae bacterium]|nr:metallophosphoesterase family protein [Gaiellaceae bacterium]